LIYLYSVIQSLDVLHIIKSWSV